jgi:YfiR/HmsC-like
MRGRKFRFVILFALLALVRPVRADEPSREYQIKAAFIYNFVQFVEWPASAFQSDSSPITIGILGDNPFGDVLEHVVQGKTVNGRSLVVRYFSRIEDAERCQVLFVNSADQGLLSALHDQLKDKSVLTIGEAEQFLWTGGVIRFYTEDNKVRFEINLEAAQQARLKISSKLLRLAKIFAK